MNRRFKKIERVLAVQEKLHELAEWKLAALDREKDELRAGQEALLHALNHDDALQGIFVEAMARRLNLLARETDRVNLAREAQSKRLFEEAMQLRRIERMTERVRQDTLRAIWKRGFDDILETLVKGDDASLP